MSFEQCVQKGAIGEGILDRVIRQKGYVPYYPDPGVPHPFDRLVASPDKRRIAIVEVKTKCRREAYADTGIDQSCFDDYQHITLTYGLRLFLVFVDAKVGTMYGNWWDELLKTRERPGGVILPNGERFGGGSYPWVSGGIVYFPLEAMTTLYVLTPADRERLLALRTTRWT
jgi:hypothetical protein